MNDIMDYCTGQKICPECSGRSFHLICGQGYRYAVCAVCGWHTGVTEKDERTIERAMDALTRARTRWSNAESKREVVGMKITWKCDRCGTNIEERSYKNIFVTKLHRRTVHVLSRKVDDEVVSEDVYNICDRCYKKLIDFVDGKAENEQKEGHQDEGQSNTENA